MKLSVIFVFIIMSLPGVAQHKIIFSSHDYVGLLEGERGSAFQLQTINGISHKTWFAGLGTGIDWYYGRSIPVFLSADKNFLKKGNRSFFLTANAGINFPWEDHKKPDQSGWVIQNTPAGFYWETGAGYRIGLGKKNDALLIQSGYSFKHIRENVKNIYNYTIPYYFGAGSLQTGLTNRFDYSLNRVSLKIGWSF